MRITTCAIASVVLGMLAPSASAGAITDVSEIGGFTQIYQFDIQNNDAGSVTYGIDNSGAAIGPFIRIG